MKYKLSKYKEDLIDGEDYYTIRYQYNGEKYRVNLSAKSIKHAKERFFLETHSDKSMIDDVRLLNPKE